MQCPSGFPHAPSELIPLKGKHSSDFIIQKLILTDSEIHASEII